jgi:4-hydroxybenzoyl-CoA thioesterase
MSFVSRQKVRFAHCDTAGIVFYPRYFELLNAAVEDYFADFIGVDFAAMHVGRGIGVPTVSLQAEFAIPSRLGDDLDYALTFEKVGSSSATVRVVVTCGDELRFSARVVLVCVQLDSGRSIPWPADIRPRVDSAAT